MKKYKLVNSGEKNVVDFKTFGKNVIKNGKAVIALGLSSITIFGFSSCGIEKKEDEEATTTISYEMEKNMVDSTKEKIKNMFSEIDEETINNATLVLLLSELAKEDENGKISADCISNFKNIIDTDNMIDQFNEVLNVMENRMLQNPQMIFISQILPQEMHEDKDVLGAIEHITLSIINNRDNKKLATSEFQKIYKLFVEEEEVNGISVRDLNYSIRAVASAYARTAAYYVRNYISEEEYDAIDKRTNDQNNKSYIKIILEKLDNQIDEESEEDVIKLIDGKQKSFNNILTGKVLSSSESINNLVSYINLKYLDSDKVSTKDKKAILGEYDEKKVNDVLDAIDAITKYNAEQFKKKGEEAKVFDLSKVIIDSYKDTEAGKNDEMALKYILSCSMRLLNSVNDSTTYDDLLINPYYDCICKYITKQDFENTYIDEEGKEVTDITSWQGVSNGVNFVCDEVIEYTLNILSKNKKLGSVFESYKTLAEENSLQTIQYVQNTIFGECEKADSKEYTFGK